VTGLRSIRWDRIAILVIALAPWGVALWWLVA
jgi:hypothetical protein